MTSLRECDIGCASAIDAGLPVLAYEPNANTVVIYGYRDSAQTLLMQDYFDSEKPLEPPAEKLGPFLIFQDGCSRPLPRRQALIEAFRIGAGNWRCGSVPGGPGRYWHG
ncbi:MAG: hypothetical protein IT210_24140 [Armatimonadetes bacterium]|nr:hypothetical protein [Armatimonadota bacterium]